MLENAIRIIRGMYDPIKHSLKKTFSPTVGNIVGQFSNYINPDSVTNILNKIHEYNRPELPTIISQETISKYPTTPFNEYFKPIYNKGHIYSEYIPPSPNAAYGVGSLGPNQLSSAFIGDRQAIAEQHQLIAHNPAMSKKQEESIFRDTGKRMPISLMLPKNKRQKRKYKTII